MGKNNRQRRQEKRRKREQHRVNRGHAPFGPGGVRYRADELSTDFLVRAAARSLAEEDQRHTSELIADLADRPDATRMAAQALRDLLDDLGASCWEAPLVTNVVRRRLSARHARLVGGGLCGPDDVEPALHVMALLLRLPALPPLPRPPEVDDTAAKILGRVRGLLAKAESTTFPEEAEALSAKAQQLMARHAIDHAMAGADVAHEVPSGRRVPLEDPYAHAKARLLNAVAIANRCRSVHVIGLGHATVLGFESDLVAVELLFTSLLVQANRAMLVAGRENRSQRQRGFRDSFLSAYGARVGQRLEAATAAEVEGADTDHGGRLLPVLVARTDVVDEAVSAMFGDRLVARPARISDHRGWLAGQAAADLADLAVGPAVRAG
jgi:hypothetical protein